MVLFRINMISRDLSTLSYRKISNSRDLDLDFFDRSEIWQAHRQPMREEVAKKRLLLLSKILLSFRWKIGPGLARLYTPVQK